MISPTDVLHPSPAPHYKTFQVFLIYCPKRTRVYPKYSGLVPPSIQHSWSRESPVDGRTNMSSEPMYPVARSWVNTGSFHKRLVVRLMIFTASVRNILDTPSYVTVDFFNKKTIQALKTVPLVSSVCLWNS
jgi:hypothetical protein